MQISNNFAMVVSALWRDQLFRDAANFYPTNVVSLLDPEYSEHEALSTITENHMIIRMKDKTEAHADAISKPILLELVSFLDAAILISQKQDVRLLVHCHLGASRSPAVAYIALTRFFGYGQEHKAFDTLLTLTNKPWPNHGIISTADRILRYDGALLAPLDSYRQKWPTRHQAFRRLNRLLKRVPPRDI
jgi:predicted protein tyrosine phosphatase